MPSLSEEQIVGRQGEEIKPMSTAEHVGLVANCVSDETAVHNQLGIESKDSKRLGISLTDFFTEEQIKVHLHSFNQCRSQLCKVIILNWINFVSFVIYGLLEW